MECVSLHVLKDYTVYPIIIDTKHNLKSFNFYLVEQKGSITLIDAGIDTDQCWDLFMQTLKQKRFSLNDIDRIILTHNHQDHIGLINRIISKRKIPVYSHVESIHRLKRDKRFFSLRIAFFRQLYQEMGCGSAGEQQVKKLKETAKKNENKKITAEIIPLKELDTIQGFEVIETPGHSPDHLVFYDEKNKLLFGGDHLIQHISSNALIEPDRNGNRIQTLNQYVDSLKKCLKLEIDTVFTGHGEPIKNHKALIEHRLTRIQDKAELFLDLIEKGNSTASEIAQLFYKEKYHQQFSLVMSEVIGHLDLLEKQKKVKKEMIKGIWHYDKVCH